MEAKPGGPDTRVNPPAPGTSAGWGLVGFSGHPGDTLTPHGPEEPHSTPFRLMWRIGLGRRVAATSRLSREVAAAGALLLLPSWGCPAQGRAGRRQRLTTPSPCCAQLPANDQTGQQAVCLCCQRHFRTGLDFGLFLSANREKDGFNVMGFSQQLASAQTCSKRGSFLPLLHPQGTT